MSDIFIKQSEIKSEMKSEMKSEIVTNVILSKKEIIDSLPKNCTREQNPEIAKTHIEWKWRFFKFPNKNNEVIEISYKFPNENRKYINKMGKWVDCDIGNEFDEFVISEYYHYTKL